MSASEVDNTATLRLNEGRALPCERGGTGRRTRLRIWRAKAHGGSTPPVRTTLAKWTRSWPSTSPRPLRCAAANVNRQESSSRLNCSRRISSPYSEVVNPQDPDLFIHIFTDDLGQQITEQMANFTTLLEELGISVSTGREVDFRARRYLRLQPEQGTAPLVYPHHFSDGFVEWPKHQAKKANAIGCLPYSPGDGEVPW